MSLAPLAGPDELAALAREVEDAGLARAESALTEPLEPLIGTFVELIDSYGPR